MVGNTKWIIIADSKRAYALENPGIGKGLRELDDMVWQADEPEEPTDQPGRSFASAGTSRSAMEPHIHRKSAESIFAKKIAGDLLTKLRTGNFDSLVFVAGPQMLSSLLECSKSGFEKIEIRTLQKNLMNTPRNELADHLEKVMIL